MRERACFKAGLCRESKRLLVGARREDGKDQLDPYTHVLAVPRWKHRLRWRQSWGPPFLLTLVCEFVDGGCYFLSSQDYTYDSSPRLIVVC